MNKSDDIDREIAELEARLHGNTKAGRKYLKDELDDENMFELFTCVDHILGVDGFDDGDDGVVDDGEEEGYADGEEEGYGDMEGEEEWDGEEEGIYEAEEGEGVEKEDSEKMLKKRAPLVEGRSKVRAVNPRINILADALFVLWKDNKELLSHVSRLTGCILQNKLNGADISQAVIKSVNLKQPEDVKAVQAFKKSKEPEQTNSKDSGKKYPPKDRTDKDKQVRFANQHDRVKVVLYTLMMFPRQYLVAYLTDMLNSDDRLFLWSVNGLLSFGAVGGQVLLAYVKQRPLDASKTMIEQMDREAHLVAKVVREREPGCFKELSVILKSKYASSTEAINRLQGHIEKLRNNMEIPGKTEFEISNTIIKALEKMIKKKRPEGIKPIITLDELQPTSRPPKSEINDDPKTVKDTKSQEPKVSKSDDPILDKLAKKLDLVTQIEKRVLKIITTSTDYIDVVQGLISLNTHGSENKEVAYPILKCCMNEKNFNKFYVAVAQKLISMKPAYAYSFTISIWDEAKELAEIGKDVSSSLKNLGLFLSSLICSKSLDHKVLKFLDITPLPLTSAKLCRIILDQMIRKIPKDSLMKICKKLAASVDIADNMKRVAKYLLKRRKESGETEPFVENKVIKWLEEVHVDDMHEDEE